MGDELKDTTSIVAILEVIRKLGPPDKISGEDTVCYGDKNIIYSIDAIEGADNYEWSVPDGASYIPSNETEIIAVDFNIADSGLVEVVPFLQGCSGNGLSKIIKINPLPKKVRINDDDPVCRNAKG